MVVRWLEVEVVGGMEGREGGEQERAEGAKEEDRSAWRRPVS